MVNNYRVDKGAVFNNGNKDDSDNDGVDNVKEEEGFTYTYPPGLPVTGTRTGKTDSLLAGSRPVGRGARRGSAVVSEGRRRNGDVRPGAGLPGAGGSRVALRLGPVRQILGRLRLGKKHTTAVL